MKKAKLFLLAVVVTATLSGCAKIWENEWTQTIPLPETEIPVEPEPWEPVEEDNNAIGGRKTIVIE